MLAEDLVRDITSNHSLRRYTTNADLLGAWAEACVRNLIARMVHPLRVSRGAIVYEGICPDEVPELDAIVWTAAPVPAVFDLGDFAIVPRGSAVAFLEVKRSAYTGVSDRMRKTLNGTECLITHCEQEKGTRLDGEALGVVCMKREDQKLDRTLQRLMDDQKAVLLLEEKNGSWRAMARDVLRLVNFLAAVRVRAFVLASQLGVNTEILAPVLGSDGTAS